MGEAKRRQERERRLDRERAAFLAHVIIAAGGALTIERSQFEKCLYPKIKRVDDPATGAVHLEAILESADG